MEECDAAVTAREADELQKVAALMTGLSEAPLVEVLAHLTAEDASNFARLRSHVGRRSRRRRRCSQDAARIHLDDGGRHGCAGRHGL